jgi:uncharacterized protein (TIGR03435 family)
MDSEAFDVVAKVPSGASLDDVPLMVRALLEERFNLVARMETREVPVLALVLARPDGGLGPALVRSSVDCASIPVEVRITATQDGSPRPCSLQGVARVGTSGSRITTMRGRHVTIAELVTHLSSGGFDRPVVDRTGLTGVFDFEYEYTSRQALAPASEPGAPALAEAPTREVALEEQLGLRLEDARAPVDILVIESAERPSPD